MNDLTSYNTLVYYASSNKSYNFDLKAANKVKSEPYRSNNGKLLQFS